MKSKRIYNKSLQSILLEKSSDKKSIVFTFIRSNWPTNATMLILTPNRKKQWLLCVNNNIPLHYKGRRNCLNEIKKYFYNREFTQTGLRCKYILCNLRYI